MADGGCSGSVLPFPPFPSFSVLPASAQTDPRLVDAIRQAQEGQGDSARAKVQRLLAATSPSDTLYPQIIYTQAMVASDANEMRRQLQRVAVEYSSSSWADDALLRLVQLDYASGNLDGRGPQPRAHPAGLPGSTLLPQAAYWAARTYFDQKNPELACRWIADGLAASTGQRRAAESAGLPGSALRRCPGRPGLPQRHRLTARAERGNRHGGTAPGRTDTTHRPAGAGAAPPPASTSASTGRRRATTASRRPGAGA